MIFKRLGFRRKPKLSELEQRFLTLNWKLFSTDEGQEYLYLLRHKIGYDNNSFKTTKDRVWADMHEGQKDCVRMIEASLHKFDQQKQKEDK